MKSKNTTKMKNELIFVDQKGLAAANKDLSEATKRLNEFVKISKNVLGSLEPSQIEGLKSNALSVISDEVKSRFMFPYASEAFNLEALGLDPEPLYEYFRKHSGLWSSFKFRFDPDFEEFQAEEKQSQIDACYYYADTPERIRLMELAKKTISLYDELTQSKLIVNPTMFWQCFTYGLFTQDYDNKLSISPHSIDAFLMKADRGQFEVRK